MIDYNAKMTCEKVRTVFVSAVSIQARPWARPGSVHHPTYCAHRIITLPTIHPILSIHLYPTKYIPTLVLLIIIYNDSTLIGRDLATPSTLIVLSSLHLPCHCALSAQHVRRPWHCRP